jgi:hypothetical protein
VLGVAGDLSRNRSQHMHILRSLMRACRCELGKLKFSKKNGESWNFPCRCESAGECSGNFEKVAISRIEGSLWVRGRSAAVNRQWTIRVRAFGTLAGMAASSVSVEHRGNGRSNAHFQFRGSFRGLGPWRRAIDCFSAWAVAMRTASRMASAPRAVSNSQAIPAFTS